MLIPFQASNFPLIHKTNRQHEKERGHHNQTVDTHISKYNCPGEEKYNLNVEQNKQYSHTVKLDGDPSDSFSVWLEMAQTAAT